jgi:glycine C-acetyltransferase
VNLGFDIGDTESPITPVYVIAGDEKTAMSMIVMLREQFGVFVSAVTYPVVPRGVILFRMIPTAAHSEEDVDRTLEAFGKMRDALKLDLSHKPSPQNR